MIIVRVRIIIALITLGLSVGCQPSHSGSSEGSHSAFQEGAMGQVGELLTVYQQETSKAPASVKDLAKYKSGWAGGYGEVNSGNVVVVWGAPIEAAVADKILAYEKATPEVGGLVLMQDATTTKRLSAEEFKSAPKASK